MRGGRGDVRRTRRAPVRGIVALGPTRLPGEQRGDERAQTRAGGDPGRVHTHHQPQPGRRVPPLRRRAPAPHPLIPPHDRQRGIRGGATEHRQRRGVRGVQSRRRPAHQDARLRVVSLF